MLQLDLPKDMEKVFDQLSKEKNRSAKEVALAILCEYAEDIEDYKTRMRASQDYLEPGRKGVSLDALKKELGL